MYGCDPVPANVQERTSDQAMYDFERIRHFTYKGHKYISFEKNLQMNNYAIGIVHDPNCSCHENIH